MGEHMPCYDLRIALFFYDQMMYKEINRPILFPGISLSDAGGTRLAAVPGDWIARLINQEQQ